MRLRLLWLALLILFCRVDSSLGQATAAALDAVAQRVIAQQHVVGASVLVARGDQILFKKSYGLADLGLDAPTPADAVYHLLGPDVPLAGIAVMQLVERGQLSLDDELSKYLPEFPLQGHRVTIRQLLSNTSGIMDYHYLGDPLESTYRQPKAEDEVVALFSGMPWTHAPGTTWDWSVSNFQLLSLILERVTGQSFADYMQQHLFVPAGAKNTVSCDNTSVVRGLSHGYVAVGDGYEAVTDDSSAVGPNFRFCSTAEDVYRTWHAVRQGKLLRPETLKQMSTAEGAGLKIGGSDPDRHYGLALVLNHEDGHRNVGQNGSLLGYSGSLYDFPADDLTVVVLTNTAGQNAYALGSALARAELGLASRPAPSADPPQRVLADLSVSAAERSQLTGTFRLKVAAGGYHDSFLQYRRTYRVFEEAGHLMLEALGDPPERLLKQQDGSFAVRSWPQDPVTFVRSDQHPLTLNLTRFPGLALTGERVGAADPQTFHRLGAERVPAAAPASPQH